MRIATLVRVFHPVNSVDQSNFHAVSSSRLASDDAGVAPQLPPSSLGGLNNISIPEVNSNEKEVIHGESTAVQKAAREGCEAIRQSENRGCEIGYSGFDSTDAGPANRFVTTERYNSAEGHGGISRGWRSLVSRLIRRRDPIVAPFSSTPQSLKGLLLTLEQHGSITPRVGRVSPPYAAHQTRMGSTLAFPQLNPSASPTTDEIICGIVTRLAGVRFVGIQFVDLPGKEDLVLFNATSGPSLNSTLALPLSEFCVSNVQRKVREANEKFSGPEAA